MLTELQRRVRSIVAQLPESGVFALAGGAALIVSGIVARPTNDLDFFAPHPQRVEALLESAKAALQAEGLEVTTLSEGPTFALWVPEIWSCALTRHDALASWGPMCRILYRLLVSLARLAVRLGRSKDLEIIVLRHQIAVLTAITAIPQS